jgi:hypothetical protein
VHTDEGHAIGGGRGRQEVEDVSVAMPVRAETTMP